MQAHIIFKVIQVVTVSAYICSYYYSVPRLAREQSRNSGSSISDQGIGPWMLNDMLGLSMCISLRRITINVYGVQHDDNLLPNIMK